MITRKVFFGAIVIVALVFLTDAVLYSQTTGVLRANDLHEIVLDRPAIVGTTVLPPGTYTVHSHIADGQQQVHFMREMTLSVVHPESSSVVVYDEAGRVKCDVQLRANAAPVTALNYVEENGKLRIVSAEIEGEMHVHVF